MSSFLDGLFTGGTADQLQTPDGTIDINNGSLAVGHSLKVTSTSPLTAAWGPGDDPLYASFYDASLEYVTPDNKYRLAAALQAKIAAGLRQEHLDTYPVQEFTPGLVALTDSNVVAAIEAARVYAAAHGGGRVIVPIGPHSGLWAPSAGAAIPAGSLLTGEIALVTFSAVSQTPLWLEGVPGAGFLVPDGCNVGIYFHAPDGTGGTTQAAHDSGGMSDLFVIPVNAGLTADGFRINGAVNCRFTRLRGWNFSGTAGGKKGAGLTVADDWTSGSGNSQFCKFDSCQMVANQCDYNISELTRSAFHHCQSQGGLYRSWLLGTAADVAVYNSGLQSGGVSGALIELTDTGFAAFVDCYTEGDNPAAALFKSTSITSDSRVVIYRYTNTNELACVCDVDVNTNVTVEGCLFAPSTKALKATPTHDGNAGPYRFINNVHIDADDALDSSIFDCNDLALKRLYISRGGRTYVGGEQISGNAIRLAAFAEDQEPSVVSPGEYGSPVEAQMTYNTTTHRPRVRGESAAAHDVAYTDDPRGVTGLIKPYATMIIDPRVFKLRSVISGGLDTLADVLHPATLASAPSSIRRPTFNAASDAFGGKPTFTCVKADDKMLSITLDTAIPIGAYPGLIVVCRATTANQTGTARRALSSIGPEFRISLLDDQEATNLWGAKYTGSAAYQLTTVSGGNNDQYAHAGVLQQTPDSPGTHTELRVDGNRATGFISVPTVTDPGGLATAITGAYIGAIDASTGNAADLEIAYVALLKQALPDNVLSAFWELADAEWALGL